jgi:hypothetical protein
MTLQIPLEGLADNRHSERSRIVEGLAEFRREWQLIANGKSLVIVDAQVGLLLSDIANRLEFTDQERYVVLGGKLANEVDAFMKQRVALKLPL